MTVPRVSRMPARYGGVKSKETKGSAVTEKNDDAVALALVALGAPVEEVAGQRKSRRRRSRPVAAAAQVDAATAHLDEVRAAALAAQRERENEILGGCRLFDGT